MITYSLCVATWPVEEFRLYLRRLMDEAEIADYADLSRRSGVNQTQFSNWRRGIAQPSRDNLRRIAEVLRVAPVKLYIAAGVNDAEELRLPETPDLRVMPQEILDLIDLYEAIESAEDQSVVRRAVAIQVAGLRAELGIPQINPTGPRRGGRSSA